MSEARIVTLGPGDEGVLNRVAPGVFDGPVSAALVREFLCDARHHLAVALDGDLVVGMASGVHYVHPDKPPELWINEVGVAPTHRRRGLGRRVVSALLESAGAHGCTQAWVLTEPGNGAARALYRAAGGVETPVAPVMFELPIGKHGDAPDVPSG
jgi:aminoglycoside 6'-N-acetyltransferase I